MQHCAFSVSHHHPAAHITSPFRDSVPLLSAGASLAVAFPSAHVTFPPRYLETLSSFRRARIISAGPWHNVVMWLVLLAIGSSISWVERSTSIGSVALGIIYEDISDTGRMVVGLEEVRPGISPSTRLLMYVTRTPRCRITLHQDQL